MHRYQITALIVFFWIIMFLAKLAIKVFGAGLWVHDILPGLAIITFIGLSFAGEHFQPTFARLLKQEPYPRTEIITPKWFSRTSVLVGFIIWNFEYIFPIKNYWLSDCGFLIAITIGGLWYLLLCKIFPSRVKHVPKQWC